MVKRWGYNIISNAFMGCHSGNPISCLRILEIFCKQIFGGGGKGSRHHKVFVESIVLASDKPLWIHLCFLQHHHLPMEIPVSMGLPASFSVHTPPIWESTEELLLQ